MCFSSSCISLRSFRSRAPSGSSSSSAAGRLTSARASATRCCWPPESWPGLRLSMPSSRTDASASATRSSTSAPADLLDLEPEGDVLPDRHVREERVGLEDHVHVPLGGGHVGHVAALEQDPARRSAPRTRRSCAASSSCRNPHGPSSEKNSPLPIVRLTSSTTLTSPKNFVTLGGRCGRRRFREVIRTYGFDATSRLLLGVRRAIARAFEVFSDDEPAPSHGVQEAAADLGRVGQSDREARDHRATACRCRHGSGRLRRHGRSTTSRPGSACSWRRSGTRPIAQSSVGSGPPIVTRAPGGASSRSSTSSSTRRPSGSAGPAGSSSGRCTPATRADVTRWARSTSSGGNPSGS